MSGPTTRLRPRTKLAWPLLSFFKPASFLCERKASACDSSGIKVEKRPVDAMDVDDEPVAPLQEGEPLCKGGLRGVKRGGVFFAGQEQPVPRPKTQWRPFLRLSSCSASPRPSGQDRVVDLESITIEENPRIDHSFEFEINRVRSSGTSGCTRSTSRMPRNRENIQAVEARDPHGFREDHGIFATEGFALSLRGLAPFLWRDRDPQPRWRQYTRDVSLLRRAAVLSMGGYDAAWAEYKTALSARGVRVGEGGRVYGAQRSKFSEWRKRAKEYRDKIPGLHQHQSERVLSYIKEREGILREIQTRKNTLAVISCIASAPNSKKKTAPSRAASPPGRPERRERPLSEEAAPPPPPPSIPRKRGKAMSDEPEIAVLERGSISGSDDVPLSVLQSAKGKGKSKMDAAPAPRRRRSPPSLMTASRSAGSAGEGRRTRGRRVGDRHEEGEGEEGEAAGERGDDGAAEHLRQRGVAPGQRPFRLRRALDSTGGNKSSPTRIPTTRSTRAFQDLEAQVTLASLPCRFLHAARGAYGVRSRSPMRSLALRGRRADGGVHALPRDNVTCEASPVEFDWEVTDGALPDINAEFLELQLTLMLEIAEQVGDWDDERLLARFMHHLRIMGTDEDVSRLGARSSGASISPKPNAQGGGRRPHRRQRDGGRVRKGDESGDVSMDGVRWTNEGLLSRRAQRLGRVVSHARSSDSFEDGRVEVPSGPRSFSSASRPSALVSLLVTGPTSTPRKSVPTPLQTPRSPPAVAASSSLSLSTSIFGKAGSLLSTKPNETSEGGAGGGDSWRGELDAEGESSSGIPRVRRRAQGRT
ncbi:hypothetical protein B0H13DRAFT_1924965 [Mycena leptocephala]|nr:hypothetical protein B0H13DRAFT_1924965 [Mycena leptocephala]